METLTAWLLAGTITWWSIRSLRVIYDRKRIYQSNEFRAALIDLGLAIIAILLLGILRILYS